MLNCLKATLKTYDKDAYVYRHGEYISSIAVLVAGKLHIQQDDYWGNSNIINAVDVGEIFGEAYATPNSEAMLNDVIALENSSVLFLDAKRLLTTCSSACKFHSMVVRNLFYLISDKSRRLVGKLEVMTKRSTREKLMSYLSSEAQRQNSPDFTIAFNRQQLADFLSVDRSAMSNELCKMRDDGLIKFKRTRFVLISG